MKTEGDLDPVALSVLVAALTGIAEEMGALLVRGAYSSNIKERRDCSAALFDAAGAMVAQAAHVPVHLGAMPESVAAVIAHDPAVDDVWLLNDPFTGGSHLPDLTLISPVTMTGEDGIDGFAATRAHHSDVGGMRPGSMPADSRDILQEGIVIPPVRLVRAGELDDELWELLLANVRTPDVRRGDLRAQLAAGDLGRRRLRELAERRGPDTVRTAFAETIAYGERRTREALEALPDGCWRAAGEIEGDGVRDEDIPLRVRAEIAGSEMTVDFAGSAEQVDGNVNCPLAVTRAACCFVLRVLLGADAPANAGTYAPLTVLAPEASVVSATRPAAVVAGNVETSQRIAAVLLAALADAVEGLPAEGHGTMNNVVIGGRGWTYYETVGGGQGAGPEAAGDSGVHVGMTNTLNTPVEALELELPLRVERSELRAGSGGEGRHRGGDGVERSIRVLEPATVSLLCDRRRHRPRGADGGSDGALGESLIDAETMAPKATRELAAGQLVTLLTPGGGGWGAARQED